MIKMNMHPDMPKPENCPDDASLTNFTLNHDATRTNARLKFSMSSIPKDRWQEIFGNHEPNSIQTSRKAQRL